MDPKEFARSKRRRRFGSPQNVRKADPNGHTLRKTTWVYGKPGGSFFMWRRNPSGKRLHTPFEDNLGVVCLAGKEYSFNRHKRWEKIDDCILRSDCDEVWRLEPGARRMGCERASVRYYDLNELEDNFLARFRKNPAEKEREALMQEVVSRSASGRAAYRQWLKKMESLPKNVRSPPIRIKSLSATSTHRGCSIRRARIRSLGSTCYWRPEHDDNPDDFMVVDLGKCHVIEAVSTRGRPIWRRWRTQWHRAEQHDDVHDHFVKKYRLFHRNDAEDAWMEYADVLTGNSKPELEAVQKLVDPADGTVGLKARYLRFQPLSAREDGYQGSKALRIGVYGTPVKQDIADETAAKFSRQHHESRAMSRKMRRKLANQRRAEAREKNGFRSVAGENFGEDEPDWREFAMNGHHVMDWKVSAVVIELEFPVAPRTWGNRNWHGINCEGCGRCRVETFVKRDKSRRRRRELRRRTALGWF